MEEKHLTYPQTAQYGKRDRRALVLQLPKHTNHMQIHNRNTEQNIPRQDVREHQTFLPRTI